MIDELQYSSLLPSPKKASLGVAEWWYESAPKKRQVRMILKLTSSEAQCKQSTVLQELSQILCALPYKFVFSSDTCNVTLKGWEKNGATFWIVVINPGQGIDQRP